MSNIDEPIILLDDTDDDDDVEIEIEIADASEGGNNNSSDDDEVQFVGKAFVPNKNAATTARRRNSLTPRRQDATTIHTAFSASPTSPTPYKPAMQEVLERRRPAGVPQAMSKKNKRIPLSSQSFTNKDAALAALKAKRSTQNNRQNPFAAARASSSNTDFTASRKRALPATTDSFYSNNAVVPASKKATERVAASRSNSNSNNTESMVPRRVSDNSTTMDMVVVGSKEEPLEIDLCSSPSQRSSSLSSSSTDDSDDNRKPAAKRTGRNNKRRYDALTTRTEWSHQGFGPQRAICAGFSAEFAIDISSSDDDDTDDDDEEEEEKERETTQNLGWEKNDDEMRKILEQKVLAKHRGEREEQPITPPRQQMVRQNASTIGVTSVHQKYVRKAVANHSPAVKHRGIVPAKLSPARPHGSSPLVPAKSVPLRLPPKYGKSSRALHKSPPLALKSILKNGSKTTATTLPSTAAVARKAAPSVPRPSAAAPVREQQQQQPTIPTTLTAQRPLVVNEYVEKPEPNMVDKPEPSGFARKKDAERPPEPSVEQKQRDTGATLSNATLTSQRPLVVNEWAEKPASTMLDNSSDGLSRKTDAEHLLPPLVEQKQRTTDATLSNAMLTAKESGRIEKPEPHAERLTEPSVEKKDGETGATLLDATFTAKRPQVVTKGNEKPAPSLSDGPSGLARDKVTERLEDPSVNLTEKQKGADHGAFQSTACSDVRGNLSVASSADSLGRCSTRMDFDGITVKKSLDGSSASGNLLNLQESLEAKRDSAVLMTWEQRNLAPTDLDPDTPMYKNFFADDRIMPSVAKKEEYDPFQEDDEEEELPPWMESIEHRSFKTIDGKTGLPTHEFSVCSGDDSVLYQFRLFVAQSGIPGAKYGAFIEFLGAWRLNEESRRLNEELHGQLQYYDAPTREPLQAVFKENDSPVTVRLTGENLHGFDNRYYVPRDALRALKAAKPQEGVGPHSVFASFRKNVVKVTIVGEHLEIPAYEAHYIGDSSVLPVKPVGHYKIHTQFDYERDMGTKFFETNANCIDVGRYGPFRKKDRKPDDLFVLKSFVFSQLPADYSFGVNEQLFGMVQTIDISSDVTGEPHEIAKSEIPMYVNEVGHSSELQQNVFIRDIDDRVVKYFFKPNGRMKVGMPIELLTNYKNTYEGIRERHGYGYRSLVEGLPSDRESLGAFLERNYVEREDVQNVVKLTTSIHRLHYLVSYIYYESWSPIFCKVQCFYNACTSNAKPKPLTPAQWVGILRLSWMTDEFSGWIESHDVRPEDQECVDEVSRMLSSMYKEGQEWFAKVMKLDRERAHGILDDASRTAIDNENLEMICFELRDSLPRAMKESVYCPVARRLLTKLCKDSQQWIFGNRDSNETAQLLQDFYAAAEASKNEVVTSIATNEINGLTFAAGVQTGSLLSGSLDAILSVFKTSPAFYLQCNTTPKGVKAALLEACLELNTSGKTIHQSIGDHFVMATYDGPDLRKELATHEHLAALGSVPAEKSTLSNTKRSINETWYIQWQVLYLVDIFASRYCGGAGYELETLCAKLGADPNVARFVTERGILDNDGLGYRDFCQVKKRKLPISKQRPLLPKDANLMRLKAEKEKKQKSQNPAKRKVPKSLRQYELGKIVGEKENCIYKGPPITVFPGSGGWPEGWYQKTEVRLSGASEGEVDHYWYTPSGKRLRSGREILRYLIQHNMVQHLGPAQHAM